ncbi:MAG: 50S ribosomal protein L11 methyltransferase [Deltaproteobacteria bacterium]|nr:50S ribosomal protein L11 methyltransferase [Deltaproteobacteria bacterium]
MNLLKIETAPVKTIDFKGRDLIRLSQLKLEASEQAASLISDFLLGLGSLGVAEDIRGEGLYEVSAYFPMETDIAIVIDSLKEYSELLKQSLPGVTIGPVTVQYIDRSGWEVWKSVLKKIRVGKRVIIRPPWEEHIALGNEIVIEINPSLAFGTGHHETTRLCIEAIEDNVQTNDIQTMLDVGCGSGILSTSALKLGVRDVAGFDTDPIAIQESRKNAEKNGVLDKINFFCGYIQSAKGQYDLIVANVYIESILLMKEEFRSRLSPGGRLIVSGIQYKRRDQAVRGLKEAGLLLNNELGEADWVALEFVTN